MTRRDFLPICLNVSACPILIIGGGHVACQKLQALLRFRVKIKVVAKKALPMIIRLAKKKKITLIVRAFKALDIKGHHLVYACTDNRLINQRIARLAKAQSLLCNITDHPASSDFISPAVFTKSNLIIAVSTSGQNPAVAVSLRNKIKNQWSKISHL